ncbi:pilus assembly protein [Novosphingobium sp. G106]|uniref:TadE/TadG family type IV pilus assembly protein n=1 Tax=Novosphingobium sp. G106 TaxID=2849500 RepID=UPI001C2D4DC4|nr:TadE/TadG family type IV pilus assembly protein [Novosphingobium sp. G106]MBV1688691.1 pilus assembly protein [Novosphingobium sp. G106]
MMALLGHRRRIGRDESGGAMIEFALVFPLFILAAVGGLYVAMLSFTSANMQKAVKEGARCYSINTTTCSSTTATATYTLQRYVSVTKDQPTFTASIAACGHLVSGTINFTFNTGLAKFNVPLSSTACFP